MLVFRSHKPIRVMRLSPRTAWEIVPPSSSTVIVRNFSILNRFPLNPCRVWINSTGPDESSFIQQLLQ
jgi:hypothetical protein